MITFNHGRFDLTIPSVTESPLVQVRSACIGIQPAEGPLRLSPEWDTQEVTPHSGEDRCGAFSGLRVVAICEETFQVEWSAVVYQSLSLAALWMRVTNIAPSDQRLLRLFVLHADPRAGSVVNTPLHPDRTLILNNGPWMGILPSAWRVRVPEDEFHQGYWSIGLADPHGGAVVAGIGEGASSFASVGFMRHEEQLGMEMGGWLWADLDRSPLRLTPGQTFTLQRMLILSAPDLHYGLTTYAALVQQYLGHTPRFPPYAGIFTAYGGDPSGEHPEHHPLTEERIDTLRQVVDTYLKPYGLDTFKTQFAGLSSGPPGMVGRRKEWTSLPIAPAAEGLIEWVYESGFTPDVYDSRKDFPHGIEAHVRDLKRRGYRPALVCRPFLNIRSGPPTYDALAADLFAMTVERWGYDYLMFDFNSADYETTEDTHTMAEGIRHRFQAVRDRVGPGIFLEACMVAPGPVLGIADGFRHAADWRGGTEANLARQACTHYYYHQRWFQLDHEFFDPQLYPFTWGKQGVEGMTASLDRVKLWTGFGALTGFSWLTGGVIEHVSPERWEVFTRALPVYGPCARPLDLLEHDPPRLWLLDAEAAGMRYHVLGLFNWQERPWSTWVRLTDLGIRSRKPHLFFDFWEQRLYGPGHTIRVDLPPCSCQILFIIPTTSQPLWVGTDRHVTGAIGLESFAYDRTTHTAQGVCTGPPRTRQCHYLYLPSDLAPVSSTEATFETPQYRLLKVIVDLDETGRRAWSVRLRRGQGVL